MTVVRSTRGPGAASGAPAFARSSVADPLATVLQGTPDWQRLPPDPAPVVRVLRRCLERDVRRRLHHIADARIELEDAAVGSGSHRDDPDRASRRRAPSTMLVAGAVFSWRPLSVSPSRSGQPRPRLVQLTALPAAGRHPPSRARLADGERLVFTATRAGVRHLFLRRLNDARPVLVDGTDGAAQPFFSPDGEWIAFFADGKLKKVPVSVGRRRRAGSVQPARRARDEPPVACRSA